MKGKKMASNVKKNFAYQMIYEILVIILPIVTSPYIARVIGADRIGKYSFSYTIASYFVLFSMLGIKNYGNREIAKNREDSEALASVFSNIFYVHLIASVICCVLYVIYVLMLKTDKIYATIQGLFVLSALFDISWFYFGIEKFKITVFRSTAIKIINVICVFVFVRSKDDLWVYCLIMALGTLLSQFLLWLPLKKYTHFKRPEWVKMTIHIKPLLVLFIPAVAVSLYKYMDKIMIGGMSSKAQLGFYENAEKVVNIPLTVIGAFGTVMLPKMSNIVGKSGNNTLINEYIQKSMKYVMCLALALTFGMSGTGTVFAPVFWGNEFNISGYLMIGLSFTLPFVSFANIIRTQLLIPQARDKEYLWSVVAGATINLVVNWLLIPEYGAVGATAATILAEIIVCFMQTFAVRKEIELSRYIIDALPFLMFGVLMFVLTFSIGLLMGKSLLTLFIQVISGGSLYCILCLLYFYKVKDKLVLNMISKLKRTK